MPSSGRLNSWKEIATFFDRDVRTVRRWEETRGLPVHRMPGGGRSGVFAYVQELEAWLKAAPAEDLRAEDVPDEDLRVEDLPEEEVEQAERSAAERAGGEIPWDEARPAVVGDTVAETRERDAVAAGWSGAGLRLAGVALVLLAGVVLYFAATRRAAHGANETAKRAADAGTPGQPRKPAANAEAQELYLRGLYLWNQRTEQSLTQSIDLFTQAIVHDPHFAAAYAGLADSYLLLRQYGHMPDGEAFPRALAASRQALALDDTSHEAHRSYGFVLNYWMWDFPEAEREFKRSIELQPDDAQTHSWYATSLFSVGHYAEAMREIDAARRLQPDSISILANRGLLLGALDHRESLAFLRDLEKANPNFSSVHTYLAGAYHADGDFRSYLDEKRKAGVLSNDKDEIAMVDAAERELRLHGTTGMTRALGEGYGRRADAGASLAVEAANRFAWLGDQERALHYLQLACDRHESNYNLIKLDPVFRPLYGRPEFQALLARDAPMDLAEALKTRPGVASGHEDEAR